MNRIFSFLGLLLFQGWNRAEGIFSVFFAIIPFLIPEWSLKYRLAVVSLAIIGLFIIKISRQFYVCYCEYGRPIRILKRIEGEGAYQGQKIIILQNPGYIASNTLLTLISDGSSISQTIGVLKVIRVEREELWAAQFIPDPTSSPQFLDKFFDEESRKKCLFASPFINENEMRILTNTIGS